MKIEYKETMPEANKEEDIILHGERIGKMTTYTKENIGSKYHAGINIRGGHLGLIQGFGDSKEEAIKAAFVDGRRQAEMELVSIAELEQKLGGA